MNLRHGLLLIGVAFVVGGLIAVALNHRSDPTEAIVEATFADLGARDFDELHAKMVAAPDKVWWTKTMDRDAQKQEFREWFLREYKTFPITAWKVFDAVREWLDRDEKYLDTTVAHGTARYRVDCGRHEDGIDCRVKIAEFVPVAPDQ